MGRREAWEGRIRVAGQHVQAPRRKPRGLGHERYDEILTAAKELFIAEGFATVTTRKLAKRVGLSQTGLYVYFKNKEEILDALCQRTFSRLGERLRQVAADAPPSLALFRRLVEGYIEFGIENPGEYMLTFMVAGSGAKAPREQDLSLPLEDQGPGMQAFLLFREQLARLGDAGLLKPLDPTLATQVVHMAMHGVVALLIARPHFGWSSRHLLVDTLVDTLLSGLARSNSTS
ncbi:MAG: TetR/AcrR family transcriptional regulator [Alphaproteobacteria bacterium]|nr:TetR/AcrR family transcriptional regulator [Alphaproteobacteria bacterium]